jgi:hypothetical protein
VPIKFDNDNIKESKYRPFRGEKGIVNIGRRLAVAFSLVKRNWLLDQSTEQSDEGIEWLLFRAMMRFTSFGRLHSFLSTTNGQNENSVPRHVTFTERDI